MFKKTITYTDYEGTERTEDFYFNLSKSELMEMQMTTNGGLEKKINTIVNAKDAPSIMGMFKDIIMKAYGEKSADGKRFVKSKELSESFSQTPAYDQLFMELVTNADAASEFINNVIPADLKAKAEEQAKLNAAG